jgi:hypothetical protein
MVSAVCEARNIFFTSNGFMGLGPDCAQEGNTLFVLSGEQTPFILRSLQQQTSDQNPATRPKGYA